MGSPNLECKWHAIELIGTACWAQDSCQIGVWARHATRGGEGAAPEYIPTYIRALCFSAYRCMYLTVLLDTTLFRYQYGTLGISYRPYCGVEPLRSHDHISYYKVCTRRYTLTGCDAVSNNCDVLAVDRLVLFVFADCVLMLLICLFVFRQLTLFEVARKCINL